MMNFDLNKSIEILERTPYIVKCQLKDLSDKWLHSNEGPETWNPYEITAHMVHSEKTNWLVRIKVILKDENKKFVPFDRVPSEEGIKPINELLDEFIQLRNINIETLIRYNINEEMLTLNGIHPEFGEVTLSQLLSTWVVHDLTHIAQISRVLAKQYKAAVGPWVEYLPILTR